MLDEIIRKSDKDEMFRQYYSPYLSDEHFRSNLKEYGEKSLMMSRWSELVQYIIQNKVKIGIYQMFHSLFSHKNPKAIFEKNEVWKTRRSKVRTLNILDETYFALVAEHKLSTFIAREQEKFNLRTMRKRMYRLF